MPSIELSMKLVASAATMALLLSGCASMDGLSSQASAIDANRLALHKSVAGAALTPAAWPRSDWWQSLHDAQLDQLMNEAFAGSPTLRVAKSRVRKALAIAQSSNAALYPHVDANAQFTRERFPEHALVPPPYAGQIETQAQLGATLSYDLDLWGMDRAAYAGAVGAARAAEVDVFAARLALSVNIAQTYVQLSRAYLQRDVAERALKQRQQLYDLTQRRYAEGLDSQLAVRQTEAALPAAREQIAQLDESIALARNQIAALLGRGPDRGLALARPALAASAAALPAAEIPSLLPAELIGRRPDVVAQRWRIEAALRDIDVAKGRFYPNINLAAFVGLQSISLPDFTHSRTAGIGPAISLPLFDGGRLRANLAGKNADYDAAVESYNQTVIIALRDVVDQITSIRSLAEQRSQQQLAIDTTQSAYDLALLRYREGVGNYLEVLTAETQLLSQQSLEVDLSARALDVSINLNRALGGGYESPVATVAAR